MLPTGLSHVPPWCESILGLKVEAVQGKQVSLEWTDMDLGVLLAYPSAVSRLLEWGHARALSSRALAAVSRFHSR